LKSLGRAGKAKGGQGASVDKLPAFMAAKNLKPFISDELAESTKPVRFRFPQLINYFKLTTLIWDIPIIKPESASITHLPLCVTLLGI